MDTYGFTLPQYLRNGGEVPPWTGETTAGRYLRELRALRQSNQEMLRQIEAETGHSFGTVGKMGLGDAPAAPQVLMELGPVWPGQSAETPGYSPQVASAEPEPEPPQPPPVTHPPRHPVESYRTADADAIVSGAQQAHAENNVGPWQTTTSQANPYVDAFANALARFEPETLRPTSMGLLGSLGPPVPPPAPTWLSNPLQQRQRGMQRAQFGLT